MSMCDRGTPVRPKTSSTRAGPAFVAALLALIFCLGCLEPLSAQQMLARGGAPMLLPGGALAIWEPEDGVLVVRQLARMDETATEDPPDLRPGDRLLTLQGDEITGADALFSAYSAIPAGTPVELTILRDAEKVEIRFASPGALAMMAPPGGAAVSGAPGSPAPGGAAGWTRAESEAESAPAPRIGGFELAAADEGIEVVLELTDPANEGIPLLPGDRILEVGGEPATSPEEVAGRWRQLAGGQSLTLTVRRGTATLRVTVRR